MCLQPNMTYNNNERKKVECRVLESLCASILVFFLFFFFNRSINVIHTGRRSRRILLGP